MGIFNRNRNQIQTEEIRGKLDSLIECSQSLSEEWGKNRANIQKQTMALEDMIDSMDDNKSQIQVYIDRIQHLEEEKKSLLDLFLTFQEQLYNIYRYTGCEESQRRQMENQIQMVKDKIGKYMRKCGIEEINNVGEFVDYEIHEVIEAVDTKEEQKALTIARVYRPGYSYLGKMIQKAQVAAYRPKQ